MRRWPHATATVAVSAAARAAATAAATAATRALGVVLAATLALAACATATPDRIVVASREIPSRLDPVRASTPSEINACELLFDGLVDIAANDSGTASPVLGLAEAIAQDPSDRALYRITLRQALWHDGRAVEAADVAASFAAYVDQANRSPRREYLLALVASVEAEGARGVLVRFREPIAEFRAWYVLAFKIVPRGSGGAPIGTGPFRFQSRREDELVFAANKSCYRGAPASSLLVLRRIASDEDRIQALLKGRVDVIADTGPLDRPKLESAGDVMVQSYMPHAFYAAAINTRDQALAGIDARRALVRAVNRAALIPGLTDRAAGVELNNGPFPNSLLTKVLPEYFRQGFPDRQGFDPASASRLARSSGLARVSATKSLSIAVPASWGELGSGMATALASQLSRSGVNAQPAVLADGVYESSIAARDYRLALVYHEGYDNLFSGISELYRSGSPRNETGISYPPLDRLLEERDGAVEATSWLANTLALHDLVSELVPYIPLFTIEKDLFYRGVSGLLIASDNPYLTAERWARVRK